MQLIIDTNILFTYFWKSSFTRRILMSQNLSLFSPEFALKEINKYKSEIMKKTNITEEEFNTIRYDLAIAVQFIPLEEYSKVLKDAIKITPDPNDIDFIALAMKFKLPIWSNDSLLKKQNKILAFSTDELLNKMEFLEAVF